MIDRSLLNPFLNTAFAIQAEIVRRDYRGDHEGVLELRVILQEEVQMAQCWEQMIDLTLTLSWGFRETPGGKEERG